MKTGHGEIAEVSAEGDSLATPEVAPEPPRKSAKPDPKLQMLKEAFGILKTASSKPTDPISNIKNDEIRSFLEFVGSKMTKYSENTKNAVQEGICDLIFKADRHYFDNNFNIQPVYSNPIRPGEYHAAPSTSGYVLHVPTQLDRHLSQQSQGQESLAQSSLNQSSSDSQRPLSPIEIHSGQPSPNCQPSPHSELSELLNMDFND